MPDLKQLLKEAAAKGATTEQLDVIYNAYQDDVKKKAQSTASLTGGVSSAPGLEPFQQFKPGVNKYVRQPAPVAPGIRNQGQAPKTVAQAQKEKPVPFSQEAFKQAAPQGISPSTANRMGAITSTASGFYRIPELIYSTFAAPQNLAADILDKPELRANYDAISKGTYNPLGVIDKTADYLQQSSVDWEKNKRKYNENITTQLMNGDFQGAARQIGDQIESSIPGMLSMYLTGPLAAAGKFAPTARTLTMAAPFAGSQLNAIKDNPNIPDYLKPLNAWLNGTAEVVLEEQFGTKALVDDALRIAKTEGREAAVNTIKNVLRPLGERFIKKVQPITNVLGNGLEEGITTFSQNVIDKYTGVDPNRGLFDNVPDSIIVGTAQGTGVTALGKGMDVLTNPKNQVKIDALSKQRDDLMNDLDSPSIPDNIKGDLVDKLTDINEEINIVLDENRAEYDALSDDDIDTLKTLNDQIDDRVDLLNNTSLSETSRQLAQNDLVALQKELAAKQKDVSTKVKQFKTKANAIQEPSTTGQVPPVIEGGENLQEGGEGVGQGVEGTQAPQAIIPQEKPELKDVKSTSDFIRSNDLAGDISQKVDQFFIPRKGKDINDIISQEYHKAKLDGSNPELVRVVEESAPEVAVQETITEAPQEFISEKVSRLREQEQAEYAAMKNPNDAVKRAEIYNRYDKPITEAIREAKQVESPAPQEKVKKGLPKATSKFEAVEVIDYTKPELNKYKPSEQLKFNQGTYEPVRLVGNEDLITLIQAGSERATFKKIKNVNQEWVDKNEKDFGISAIDAYNKAREIAKANRDINTERIVILGDKIAPQATTPQEKQKAEVRVEETQDLASKIRTLKINLGKGTAQSNIAGLPIALYNSVVEAVALSVEAGFTIAEAIDKAVKRYNLDKVEGFNKSELTKNVQESANPRRTKSVKDIDVNKIRTQSRPGNRVSKGLAVKTVGGEKIIEESDNLSTEYVKNNAPKVFISNAEKIAQYPIVSGIKKFGEIKTEAQAQEVYDIFIRQVADNLKHLTNEYNPEFRDIATLWYDGANMLANKLSTEYGVSPEQAAGIIAAMSPQKDWYMNVRLAELVMLAYKQDAVLTNEMIAKQIEIAKEGEKPFLKSIKAAKEALAKNKTKANIEKSLDAQKKYNSSKEKTAKVIEWLKKYVGTDIKSAPIEVQPYIVRLHSELNNPKEYNILRPDGEIVEVAKKNNGENSKIAWGSYSEIGKAASIYNNGSQENITKSLGEMHKIRNFYNNIIDPMSKDGDVTIDTHAVAAALMQPLSGNSKQVGENFGTGTSNSSPLGIKGLYYAYLDGYQLAAKELGLLPRQVQSITWEAVRGLFTDTFKRDFAKVKEINDIWKNYEDGKITIEEARSAVNESAGGVKDPTWSKSVLPESEVSVERGPIEGRPGVSGPDIVGEPSTVRVAAKALRKLKIDLGKGTAQSNIAGLPIALYNSAIETIALGLEAGASLTDAINTAIEKYKLSKVKEFDKDEFISKIENATGEKVKKETSITNAEVEAKRADYGFPEPAQRPFQSNKTTLEKAKQAIKDGVSVNEVIEKALNREPITDVESAMLSLYQGTKEAELLKSNSELEKMQSSSALDFTEAVDKRNKIIDDLVNAYNAGEVSGNVSARALQARKIKVLQDDSLANMLIQKRKANNNRKLTNKQVDDITKLYTKIQVTKAALEAKIEKLNEENAKLKLKAAAPKIVSEVKVETTGKTKEQLKAEREDIFKQMSELARKSLSNLSMNPIPAEMIPLVVKLAKNYLATGAKTLDEVIDKVHADLSGYIENVSKNDIRRTLADYDADTRPTKEDIQDEVFGERSKEKQIKDIEDLEEQARKEKDPEAAQLLLDEANAKRTAMEKQAEKDGLNKEQARLDNYKKNIKKRIEDLQGKLKKGDYSKTPKNEIKLDEEGRKLKKQLEDIKFDFAVELEKDALAGRNKVQKFTDGLIELFNLPRSLMATADFSAPLRQAAVVTIAYPDIAAKAAIEMGVQWASSEKAEQWMDDLMESPGYKLMQDSDLYIANVRSAKLSAKEEDFSTNLAGKIPVAGALVNASERAYVAYLNKMRVDIFNRGVELLQNDGYSFATNPKAYKTLANYVNAATGRGSLGGGALEKAGPALNALMFSPRLLASRVRLLTMLADPRIYKKENRVVRNMYLKDMSSFVGFGLAVLALAAAAGAEVEDDPRSTDFGKIKVGDTRWDIWGGFQQPIRAFVQATLEERKSSTTGKIVKLDGSGYGGETGGDVILRFFRGKLAPVPAFLVNAYTGKNVMGTPFNITDGLVQMSYPLVIQSVIESAKKDGIVFGVLATGVPSLLGVGVQTYGANDFLKQGVDDKSINLLLSKRAIAIEPNELDTKVFDVNTGEDRKMTDAEFKKYYQDWADYIKMKLRDNYDEYKDMSVEEFETEFRSIKSEATKLAKEDISGVSNTTKTISYREGDESESYKLTPEELKYRQSLNEQYISRHGNVYNKEFKEAIRNGKSEQEADIIANKRLMSKANEYSRKIILRQHKSGRGYDF
jgi:hypothetical protein